MYTDASTNRTTETGRGTLFAWMIFETVMAVVSLVIAVAPWIFEDIGHTPRQWSFGLMSVILLSVSGFMVHQATAKCRDLFSKPITCKGRITCKWVVPTNRHTAPFDGPYIRIMTEEGQLEDRVRQHVYEGMDEGDVVMVSFWPYSRKIYSITAEF